MNDYFRGRALAVSMAAVFAAISAFGCKTGGEDGGLLRVAVGAFSEPRSDVAFGHLRLAETAAAIMAEQISITGGFSLVLDGNVIEKTRTSWEFLSENPAREIPVAAGRPDARVGGEISVERGEIRATATWTSGQISENVEVRGPVGTPERNRLLLRELALRLASKAAPDDPMILVRLGVTLREEGLLKDAVETYRRAIAMGPGLASAHYNLGVALDAAGDHEGANESYARAVAADPTHVFARYNRALNQLRERSDSESDGSFLARVRDAESLLTATLNLSPRMIEAHELLVESILLLGEHGRAAQACERMIEVFPGEGRPYELLGGVCMASGRYDDAAARFARAAEIEPSVASHQYSRARALEAAGKAQAALDAYLAFLARAGSDPMFARATADAARRADEITARLRGRD